MSGALRGGVSVRGACDSFAPHLLLSKDLGNHSCGIWSSARKPGVHAAIGLASAFIASNAAAQHTLPTIDVQRSSGGSGRTVSTGPATEAPPAPVPQATTGGEPTGYRATGTGLSRVPTPLIDTPQTINVVTQEVIRDQGARTLEDALRNVPGVTFQAGEGGNQGDAPFIRGFQARTDIFRDGIRDPGWYTRDIFSTDSVEVFKGPSAFIFGRGSTGGAINLTSKQATGSKFVEGTVTGSTPRGVRAELDASGSAGIIDARIAAMWQDIDTPDRDNVWTKRWGVAPSMNVRLTEQARIKLNYIYQGEESVPDYGHPYLPAPVRSAKNGAITNFGYYGNGQPVGPVPINRSNWFGVMGGPLADRTETETNIWTGRFEYDLTKELKFANTTRYFTVDRSSRPTAPRSLGLANNGSLVFPRDTLYPVDLMTIGRQHFWNQTNNSLFVNQTEITGKVHTGSWTHTVVLGTEYDDERRFNRRAYGPNPNGTVGTNLCAPTDPDCRTSLAYPVQTDYGGDFLGWAPGQATNSETIAWYASDSIKLNEYWDIMGGIRNDQFRVGYADQTQSNARKAYLSREDDMFSYRYGLVFHPTKYSSIYGAYGVSYNPSAELGTLSSAANSTANALLPPEKNRVTEFGAKADLIPEKLTLSGAWFKVEKTNLRIPTDPTSTTAPLVLNGLAISEGLEFGLVGKITDQWQITTGYVYNATQIAKTTNMADFGHRLPNTPLNSFTLWTTYDLTPQWTIGGGAQWQSMVFVNTANTIYVPDFWKFDAMLAWKLDKHNTLQLNIYNITDELYYANYYQAHAVPAPGRYASLSWRVRW